MALAKLVGAENIELLHSDLDLRLQRRPTQPERDDLREMHHLGQFLLRERCHHRRVGRTLDAQVEVAPLVPRKIPDHYVLDLHCVRREAKATTEHLEKVLPPIPLWATNAPGASAGPFAAARTATTEEGEPHKV